MENNHLYEIQKLNVFFSQKEKEYLDQNASLIQSLATKQSEYDLAQAELQNLREEASDLIAQKQKLEQELSRLEETYDTQCNAIEFELKSQTDRVAEILTTLAQREKEFATKENTLNSLILETQNTKHEQAQKYLESLVQREREFNETIERFRIHSQLESQKIREEYQEETLILNKEFSIREHALLSEIEIIRSELKSQTDRVAEILTTLAQREKKFADERQQNYDEKHELELKNRDLSHFLTSAQQLQLQLNTELAERQQMLNCLVNEIGILRGSLTWRITAPLRSIGSWFTTSQSCITNAPIMSSMSITDFNALNDRNAEDILSDHSSKLYLGDSSSEDELSIPDEILEQPFTLPHNKESFMKSSTAAATSIEELLAYHDSDFVHCAYITLLGRSPDPEGMRYYTSRLQSGYEKMAIIQQLISSKEGMQHKAKIAHLDQELRYHRLQKLPFLGYFFSLFMHSLNNISDKKRINIIENKIYRLEKESVIRLSKLEESINSIKYALDTGKYSIVDAKAICIEDKNDEYPVVSISKRSEHINSPLESLLYKISKGGK